MTPADPGPHQGRTAGLCGSPPPQSQEARWGPPAPQLGLPQVEAVLLLLPGLEVLRLLLPLQQLQLLLPHGLLALALQPQLLHLGQQRKSAVRAGRAQHA